MLDCLKPEYGYRVQLYQVFCQTFGGSARQKFACYLAEFLSEYRQKFIIRLRGHMAPYSVLLFSFVDDQVGDAPSCVLAESRAF